MKPDFQTNFETETNASDGSPTLSVRDMDVYYQLGRGGFLRKPTRVRAVADLNLDIAPGETLGLVGESGSGKTTVGRAILRRIPGTTGEIRLCGKDISGLEGEALRAMRTRMQLVLQDPYTSLNPRMTIQDIVAEPLIVHGLAGSVAEARDEVRALLQLVGMPEDAYRRYPHSFSGGQRQRVGIARALALRPDLVVADEPVSALDVSVRAQVVNLMQDLQRQRGLSYLFIAHDLSIVRHISHRVAIMYSGRIVEIAACDDIYQNAHHPYTQALLSAVPVANPHVQRNRKRHVLPGETADIFSLPKGCAFQNRCSRVESRCRQDTPELRLVESGGAGHQVACWNGGK
ncbi:MAG: ABC transporter ATP-binding protein [Phyllobacterium sp.]